MEPRPKRLNGLIFQFIISQNGIICGPGDPGSRVENRIGEPTANPYLYIASQVIAGRDGIRKATDPGAPSAAAYLAERALLPGSLFEALKAFERSTVMKEALGERFHHYFYSLKKFEADRFLAAVTDWEHAEYFEMF